MSYYGSWKIDALLTFVCDTHSSTTAGQTDADSAPTYRIYEDETGTPILTGTMALLDDSNTVGFYSEQVTLSAANGFERGKSYHVRIHAIVGSVAANITHNFQIGAHVDLTWILGTLLTETAGQIAAGFKKLFDVASPVFTLASVNQTGDGYARLGAPAGASTAADIAAVNAKTTNLPGSPAAVGSAMTLTSGERTSVADALLDRDMSTGTDSGSPTVRTVRQALRFNRNKVVIADDGTMTVYKENDATASWTAQVTQTPGDPVSAMDPA